jgi:hypothetical protein
VNNYRAEVAGNDPRFDLPSASDIEANEQAFESLGAFNRALDRAFPGSRRELQVLPVSCRFYGFNGMFGGLIPTHGNQCGLITDRHAPCQMEMAQRKPDEKTCSLVLRIFGEPEGDDGE